MTQKNSPLVSIIVPNFNHARFLNARLSSISKQSLTDVEIILLDDASNDDSVSLLREFASNNSSVSHQCYNTENAGRAISQWQRGIALTRGKYIWIAESDDVAHSSLLAKLVVALEQSPQAGIAYCHSQVIDEYGEVISEYDYSSPFYAQNNLWEQNFAMNGRSFTGNYMAYRNVIPNVSTVLFNAAILKRFIRDSHFKYCADWQLYCRILLSHDVFFIHEPLNQFRKHIQSSRWHNPLSYSQERKEKLSLLRNLYVSFSTEPVLQNQVKVSIEHVFHHRHKHRKIAQVCQHLVDAKLRTHEPILLFGANDIAEKIADTALKKGMVVTIVDSYKSGQICFGQRVKPLNTVNVNAAMICVLCTFSHQNAMKSRLEELNFAGQIIEM